MTIRAGVFDLEELGISIETPIAIAPAYLQNGELNVPWSNHASWLRGKELPPGRTTFMSGVAHVTTRITAGYTYRWGAYLETPAGYLPEAARAAVNLTVQCVYN